VVVSDTTLAEDGVGDTVGEVGETTGPPNETPGGATAAGAAVLGAPPKLKAGAAAGFAPL